MKDNLKHTTSISKMNDEFFNADPTLKNIEQIKINKINSGFLLEEVRSELHLMIKDFFNAKNNSK